MEILNYVVLISVLVFITVVESFRIKHRRKLKHDLELVTAQLTQADDDLDKASTIITDLEQSLADYATLKKEYATTLDLKNKYYEKQTEIANRYNALVKTTDDIVNNKDLEISKLKADMAQLKNDMRNKTIKLTDDNQKLAKMIDNQNIVAKEQIITKEESAPSVEQVVATDATKPNQLDCDTVRAIRIDLKTMSRKDICKKYNISKTVIHRIDNNQTYQNC